MFDGAPESTGFARMDDGAESAHAKPMILEGTVYDAEGRPVPHAKVEVWHANTLGNYSFFDKSQSDFNHRRTIITDEKGRYKAQSIVPNGYGCPPEGYTQALLNQLGRHGRRPAHVHYFVTAPGPAQAHHPNQHRRRRISVGRLRFRQPRRPGAAGAGVNDEAAIAAQGLDKPYAHDRVRHPPAARNRGRV